ncbi:MAG: hypothetical protein HN856_08895 [Gammaproteobacteria bacterium]|jgi:1-acyl-sn-glycerol-3-phosphate acyltransferase|nr:hypothetical protein [Gammaproteobacteria bacterium]
MQDYDSIRPFNDQEVRPVIQRVLRNPEFGQAASRVVMPKALQGSTFGNALTIFLLRQKTKDLNTVADCQNLVKHYFRRLVANTISDLTVSGLQDLDPQETYLFISNHRDIVMDSGLLNFLLHDGGHDTCRMAVGDNLFGHELAADLMRLNKSFIVERNLTGVRATLNSLNRTSHYIRHSLSEGASIWIAQREGRSKDGWDRTDPALLKMLALAYKAEDAEPLKNMIAKTSLVPVSISYELDPCALRKAHELSVIDRDGAYAKQDEEDLQSIITGIVGFKGRVHLHFGLPIRSPVVDPVELALTLDRQILSNMRIYPTHVAAARMLSELDAESRDLLPAVPESAATMMKFEAQIQACPTQEQPFLLKQYANPLLNRQALGL